MRIAVASPGQSTPVSWQAILGAILALAGFLLALGALVPPWKLQTLDGAKEEREKIETIMTGNEARNATTHEKIFDELKAQRAGMYEVQLQILREVRKTRDR